MREPFPLSGWLVIGLLIAVVGFLLAGPHSQAASNSFTLTEIDPTGNNYAGYWQYEARTNSPQDTITSRQDSPWHWRHYDPTDTGKEHIKCDDVQYLYPAEPNSPDTTISANGQTVTVNIYQAQDSVYVCFALECDDGTYSFALMRNLQTEKTITSGPCGGNSNNRVSPPNHPAVDLTDSVDNDELDPVDDVDLIDDQNGQGGQGPDGDGQDDQNNGQGDGQGNQSNDQDDGQANENNVQSDGQDNQEQSQDGDNQGQPDQPPPIDQTPSK